MKLVTTTQMRQVEEQAAAAEVSSDTLMEAAGLVVARRIARLLEDVRGKRLLVLVGPGNNGGDGMVAARYLSDWGALITLYMTSSRRREDKLEECRSRRVRIVEAREDQEWVALSTYLPLTDMVVDAVFGTGQDRPLEGPIRDLFARLSEATGRQRNLKLVAVDVPTGVDADAGTVDEVCPKVNVTITLGFPKVGLFRFPAAAYVGQMEVADIGLPAGAGDDILLELADDGLVASLLPPRPLESHKGAYGRLLVVGGSRSYVGAPVLACGGAYRAGAGLVVLASPASVYPLAAAQMAEPTYLPLEETPNGQVATSSAISIRQAVDSVDAAVLGPGLGESETTRELVQRTLLVEPVPQVPLVLDADALNALARTYGWWGQLGARAVLTPHPGEMARLLRCSVVEVQEDRVAVAQHAAQTWGQVVALKGAYTVVASPDGRACVSPFANPALASAGTGDVLAGVIGGLLAQGITPYAAAVAGVYLHGSAGERIRAQIGDAGLVASDLLPYLPRVMQRLRGG